MLSVKRIKRLLNNKKISDKKAKKIRDDFRTLAEIILEQWEKEKKSSKK